MKKFTTLKTLLVGLLALGATSVWADATVIYERGTTTAWSDADLSEWEGSGSIEIASGLKTSGGNEGYERAVSISTKENSLLVLTATWDSGSSTGRNGGYNYLVFGNVEFRAYGQDPKGTVIIGGVETQLTNSKDDVRGGVWTVTATIDKAKSKVSYSVVLPSGTKEGEGTLSSTSDFNSFKMGYYKPGKIASTNQTLQKIEITEEEQTVSKANYTVQFLCETETIKEAETRSGVIDNPISLPANDSQPIKVFDDNNIMIDKYIYVSDDAGSKTIKEDGSTVVTVNFRKANTYNYTAKNSFDEILATGSGFEGEYADYYWAAVKDVDGVLYTAPAVNSAYKGSILLDADNKEANVTYTASEDITTLVYLAEGEDVFTKALGSSADTRGSMGAGGYMDKAKTFVTLPAGKYKLVVSNRCTGERIGIHIFTAGTGTNAVTIFAVNGYGYNQTWTSEEFTLTANTDLYFEGGSENQWVDYLYIYKTGDVELPESVTVPVTSAGYATYCSEYDLDLTGIVAYTATQEGSQISFVGQAGNKVAAGTGLLIKKENGGDVTINVAKDGAKAVANNALIGVVASQPIAAGSFVLMASPAVGFYKTLNEFTVGANTAYIAPLPASSVESVREFIAIIGGEATAIKTVESEQQNGEIYNLAGQRVNKAQKGLFIQNGKKVIIK